LIAGPINEIINVKNKLKIHVKHPIPE